MSTTALYVGNLPFNISHQQISDLFHKFNPSTVAFVQGRNFAYVDVCADHALAAVEAMNGHLVGKHNLIVKEADYLEPRVAQLVSSPLI